MAVDNTKLGTDTVVWRLDDLYNSTDDELISDDIDLCEQEAELLEEGCRGRLSELEVAVFARTIRRLERIAENLGRIATYAFLNFSTQVMDAGAGAFLQQVTETASRINRRLVFFTLEWSKMDEASAQKYLDAGETAKYRHYLEKIRRQAQHLLSECEEKLLIELEPVGKNSWTILFEKVMASQQFGESGRSEEEVLAELYSPDRNIRRQAAEDLTRGLHDQLHVLTHIFNTLAADKMIDDRLRSYPSWDQSMHLENELEDATVNTLVESVTARYDIVSEYYTLKKEILGLDTLYDYDRYAPVPGMSEAQVDWPQCREMVLAAFAGFSGEIAEIAAQFFNNNWIHAPIMEGKRGGAFAHPCVPDTHPYVMVNYTGNLHDVATVAHELGHGVHQVLAADQGMFNSDTPLVLAETASVFAELLVFHSQLDLLAKPEEKRAYICQKIESIFATVFRQIAMNRFEDAMHTGRRNQGELSSETLSAYWLSTQKAMFGDSVILTEDYGIWWSYIPHFLSTPGYVYSYAFGELLVLGLYRLYQKEGEAFVNRYIDLLRAGGKDSPYALLEPFGLDINQPEFWQGGLGVIEDMVDMARNC
ncbi:MAG: M3 family oligoendopeptidase [Desulfobulbaceae bacterium]|nr:M3 family oligoendopeptidase [Desulfobulbaceae bacterium]